MTCDVVHVVGARPNFVKMAPVHRAIQALGVQQKIVHSGQHYDEKMSDSFFTELEIPAPDINFNIMGGSHGVQTGRVLIEIEKYFLKQKPTIAIVYGDVNTTLSAAIAAKKLGILVAHVESGLRSFDMSMPEEQNRVMVDAISDILFVTEEAGLENLQNENNPGRAYHVGNTMIDSLHRAMGNLDVSKGDHCVATFHRPSNVDSRENLLRVIEIIESLPCKVIWPVHPRTQKALNEFGLYDRILNNHKVRTSGPVSYLKFIELVASSRFVITDSGGIQEEAAYLKIPCITYRTSTERPSTVASGSNTLTMSKSVITRTVDKALSTRSKEIRVPDFWDGKASTRIASILQNYF